MSSVPIKIPKIANKDKTPLVTTLLTAIESQHMMIKRLEKTAKGVKTEIVDPVRLNIYNVLKDKRSFEYMPDEMLKRLVKKMKILRIKKGETILKQGELSAFVYLMLRGCVSVTVDDKLIYTFNRIGDIFGEMSFLDQTVCSATICAEDDLELIVISKKALKYIGNEDFYLWLCRILTEKLDRTSHKLSHTADHVNSENQEPEKLAHASTVENEIDKTPPSEEEVEQPASEEEVTDDQLIEKNDEPDQLQMEEGGDDIDWDEEDDLLDDDETADPDDFFAPPESK